MSLSGSTVLEVRIGGSDTNSGGWVTGSSGVDYSQQNAAQYSVTDGVTNGTTTITSATANFGTDVVGNLIYVSGGTGAVAANWYQIVTRTSATAIVVDRSTGLTAGTGVTLHIGGALATPGAVGPIFAAANNGIGGYVKYSATLYTMTTATAGAGGPVGLPSSLACWLEGYDVTRGDRTGNRPVLSWGSVVLGSASYAIVGGSGRNRIANLVVDGNSQAFACGYNLGTRNSATACVARNCNGTGGIGYTLASIAMCVGCQATSCLTGFSGPGNLAYCAATACTTAGFAAVASAADCLASSCGSGFTNGSTVELLARCTADGCTTAGFDSGNWYTAYVNCLATNQSGGGGIGFKANNIATLDNCASYNNTTEVSGTPLVNEGMILNAAFTGGQPYVSAGSDFRPNATAGAGALLRNAGIGCFGQADNADIGAVQHSDPASGPASSGCCSMP